MGKNIRRIIFLMITFILFFSFSYVGAYELPYFKGLSGTLHIAGGTAHIACEKEAINVL